MHEEIKKKLIEWVERLSDIASEQIPDFAQQVISYQVWNSTIWMYVGIGILSVIGLLFVLCVLLCYHEKGEDKKILGWFIGVLFLVSLIPISTIFSNYSIIKKCEVAPKLVIIDYIKGK